MKSRVSKAQTRRSRVIPPKAFQEKLLDAVANTGAELPHCVNRTLTQDATAVQGTKRQLDEASEELLPVKRARLTQTGVQAILQQPKPISCRSPSFLKEFIDLAPQQSVATLVSEWLESVGSNQDKRCWSDSYLQRSSDNPISRRITRSAPEISYTQDPEGFRLPPTPASARSRSCRDTDARSVAPSDTSRQSSKKSLIEEPYYRTENLATNNIYLRPYNTDLPARISSIVDIVRKDRNTLAPSLDQLRQDPDLAALEMGAGEPIVEQYFRTNIFPFPKATESLARADKQPMSKHAVPNARTEFRVSTPVPDMLFGYRREAFPQQQAQLLSMGRNMVANNQGLIYPFFVVEFKGDGPSGSGSMWVAENQCLSGSTSCVNIVEHLNHQLRECKSNKIEPTDSAAFSIAINNTEARLYISWKHDEFKYHMQRIDGFLLYDPEHYLKFRKYVWNIIDWGKDRRLNEIRDSLDFLREESTKRTSKAPRQSLKPKNSSRSSKVQRHSVRAVELYQEPYRDLSFVDSNDHTTSQGIDEGPAGPWYLDLEDEQQDQSQLLLSFDSSAEVPPSFATSFTSSFTTNYEAYSKRPRASQSPPVPSSKKRSSAKDRTAELPTATADNHWTWSESCKRWYHLNEDGSRKWA